jgi:hypothetical protein
LKDAGASCVKSGLVDLPFHDPIAQRGAGLERDMAHLRLPFL